MGIVEVLLAEEMLTDGRECRIEYNRGGEYHVHIGATRIDMTEHEFQHFADVVSEAKENLIHEKGIEDED